MSSSSSESSESSSSHSSSSSSSESSESGEIDEFLIDPYTQAYRAFRSYLLADAECVARGIKAANTPDLTSTTARDPLKSNKKPADFPEVLIVPNGFNPLNHFTNTGFKATRTYSIRLAADQIVLHRYYHPIQWALTVALVRLKALNPQMGLEFIESVKTVGGTDTFSNDAEALAASRGWVSVLNVEVGFLFNHDQINIHRGK